MPTKKKKTATKKKLKKIAKRKGTGFLRSAI
jgi:hypothetical protein